MDLLASSDHDLQVSLEQFAVKSEAAGMISTSKSKMDLTWRSVELGGDLEEHPGHAVGNKPWHSPGGADPSKRREESLGPLKLLPQPDRISGWMNRWMDRWIYEDSKKLCTSAPKRTLANMNN